VIGVFLFYSRDPSFKSRGRHERQMTPKIQMKIEENKKKIQITIHGN
jgi:hypothetical protein